MVLGLCSTEKAHVILNIQVRKKVQKGNLFLEELSPPSHPSMAYLEAEG
jgi:hypothetical protein